MHPSSEHASWPAKTPHWSTPIRILAAAALLATAFTQVDAAEWQVKPLTGEQARDYDLDTAFYKRATFVQGILIATSARVPDHVHREAAYQFDSIMRLLNEPIAERIRERKVLCLLLGVDELTSDLPQFGSDKTGAELDFYNWRQRGFLTRRAGHPLVLFAEEDVMEYEGGMQIESILIHEFGHVIHGAGFDDALKRQLTETYESAVKKGLWNDGRAAQRFRRVRGKQPILLLDALAEAFPKQPRWLLRRCLEHGDILVNGSPTNSKVEVTGDDKVLIVFGGEKRCYAGKNRAEYWAEGVQSWFDTNRTMDHDHNHIHTREQLKEYDPGLAKLCKQVLGDPPWRFVSPRERAGKDHLGGYDPAKAPVAEDPDHIKEAANDYYDEYWSDYWQRLYDKHAPATLLAAASTLATPDTLESQFRELPMEARRLTGPLFWMHGDENETPQRLETYLEKVAEGGNGCFTAESRPHSDWLGPRWYRDLDICLQKAKSLDLEMWIFDERWWPSQSIGGRVPPQYAAKSLVAEAVDVEGPKPIEADGYGGERYIAAVAGRLNANKEIEGDTLLDLAPFINGGKLSWDAPAGNWQVIKFTHQQAPGLGQRGGKELSVDGASRDCTDWFIKTVYQPHFDRFKDDFGKAIPGFFYDEPETKGDWGTELGVILKEWGVDWKKAYVGYKFTLAGDDGPAARYRYMEANAEAWGRVMYGRMTEWCENHGVASIGHFMEHGNLYLHPTYCGGDMMRLQKYSSMGGIDMVCRQMYPGQRPHDIYQTPKLGSSISHVYGKKDDLAMCEIFGGYNQVLTYPQMKWLTDQHQVRGINFMIPHSFNPKAPNDRDYPPYFYNDGHEPRWPLYRVYADYTSRLSLMLTGGHHVCPVAVLFSGNAKRVGKYVTPEDMTTVLQDALYDCDWLPFEAFENLASVDGRDLSLHHERYQVLVVPPTELIPHPTLAKVKKFFDQGGVVLGYGHLPSISGTVGTPSAGIGKLRDAIWGSNPNPGTTTCKTSPAGGRSYFLPEEPDVAAITAALHQDAGIPPVVEVLDGQTDNWLHVLHRVKDGRDVFLICNQDHEKPAKTFRLKVTAIGIPEIWDAMRNEICSVDFTRHGESVEFPLTLEPLESVLMVFNREQRTLPPRLTPETIQSATPITVTGTATETPPPPIPEGKVTLNPVVAKPFSGSCQIPDGIDLSTARVLLEMDELAPEGAARVTINGKDAGGLIGRPLRLEVSRHLKTGENTIRIEPFAPKSVRLLIVGSH